MLRVKRSCVLTVLNRDTNRRYQDPYFRTVRKRGNIHIPGNDLHKARAIQVKL